MNPPESGDSNRVIAIVGGRLIDGRGGQPIERASVVIRGNKIIDVGRKDQVAIPTAAEVIDISGKTVLPGLIDSHFHSKNDLRTPIEFELLRGITSFRDPGHPFKYYELTLRANETLPRIFLCGGHLDAAPAVHPDQAVVVQDADHARRAVADHVSKGASAIKIYFRLPIQHIRAACESARQQGVIVTAHLELVDADEAIAAGVRGIEHVTSFETCLADPEDAKNFKSLVHADSSTRRKERYRLWARINLEHSSRVKSLLDTIVDRGVFVSPTLAVFERRAEKQGTAAAEVDGFANMVRFAGMCHRAGARVVVGSHTSAQFAARGRAYQRELELLVQAGMSPLEVITAATLQNARFFGIADRLGTIELGKTADLLVVDGNPATDIAAMEKVHRVMLNGNWFDK